MDIALGLAEKSLKNGDVPIGAVIVRGYDIIGKGYNKVEKNANATKHAEIIAINEAIKTTGYKHLIDCTLYVTLEPCPMCAGAIVLSRLKTVIFGAYDPKAGAGGSILNLLNNAQLNHRCEVYGGFLEERCSSMITHFFKDLRRNK
ncbi:MAG: tRNA adenosine(34) deaminase TadA [Candidatus Kapabacteria bacterium]|nr:tRNA adenosine(34) deaminase TadA [Ignavibacteriota bacterium]MCW5883475.1 tRNA adenosine(34) deaminase TadA [Candidatus Kapabacteria bacterium]